MCFLGVFPIGVFPRCASRYFDFDGVLEERRLGSQEEVYVTGALPSVDAFLNGYSACVLVYGQTGSGKTHTMFGGDGALEAIAKQCVNDGHITS